MNRFITISGIALLLPLASCAARDIEPTIIGDTLEFTLRDFDGNEVRHTDVRFKGKVVLVDIWGTWCPPCRDAVPNLVDMQEKYSDAGPVIVGVAFEDSEDPEERRERVMKFVDEYRVNYLMLDGTQAGSVSEAFPTLQGFRGFPTMIVVGRDGKVAHANTVFPRENKRIRKEVEKALGLREE